MLGLDTKIKCKKNGAKLTIYSPPITPANNPSEHAWVFKIENAI